MSDFDDWPDELQELWDEAAEGLSDEFKETFLEETAEYFEIGFMDPDADPDERELARELFFLTMEDFDLDIHQFDWNDWRDWYEDA